MLAWTVNVYVFKYCGKLYSERYTLLFSILGKYYNMHNYVYLKNLNLLLLLLLLYMQYYTEPSIIQV